MPRPRTSGSGAAAVGTVLGAVVGTPLGSGVGGLLGEGTASEPVPLDDALRHACARAGKQLAHWRRTRKTAILVAFQDANGVYWRVECGVPSDPSRAPADLDDALYDAFVATLDRWHSEHAVA